MKTGIEFTYQRLNNWKSVEKIEGLSWDAAEHIAKANSAGCICVVSCERPERSKPGDKVIEAWHYKDNVLVRNYFCGEE